MMSKKEKFEEDVEKAVKWLATEHNFFLELKKDLPNLKKALLLAKKEITTPGIRKVLQNINYWGGAERRFNRYLTNARSLAKTLKDKAALPAERKEEIDELIKELDVEAAHLIRDCSRYDGKLHQLFTHLDENLQKKDFEQAQQVVMELEMTANDAEKWIEALSVDLKKAKQLADDFSESYHESIDGIKQAISHLTFEAQHDYLAHLLKNERSLKKDVYIEVFKLFLDRWCSSKVAENSVEYLEKKGAFLAAAQMEAMNIMLYGVYHPRGVDGPICTNNPTLLYLFDQLEIKRRFDHPFMRDISYTNIAENYERAGYWMEAGEFYEGASQRARETGVEIKLISYIPSAIQNYIKARLYLRVARLYKIQADYADLLKRESIYREAIKYFLKAGDKTGAKVCLIQSANIILHVDEYYHYNPQNIQHRLWIYRRNSAYQLLRTAGYPEKEAWIKIAQMSPLANRSAECYEKAGDWANAARAWERAKKPDKARKALQKISKSKKLSKRQRKIVDAEVLFQNKKYSEALKLYESAQLWERVADCYNQMGQGVMAMNMYKKAVVEYQKKFGLVEKNLPMGWEADAILQNIHKASDKDELKKAIVDVLQRIERHEQAGTLIIKLASIPLMTAEYWRMIGDEFSKRDESFLPSAAEAYIHAGSIDDLRKAINNYHRVDRTLANILSASLVS